MTQRAKLLAATALVAMCGPASALSVEQDHPGFRDQRTSMTDAARAAEAWGNNAAQVSLTAHFTGASQSAGVKRKAFPPGYGRSGFEFEDEILARQDSVPVPAPAALVEGKPAPAK